VTPTVAHHWFDPSIAHDLQAPDSLGCSLTTRGVEVCHGRLGTHRVHKPRPRLVQAVGNRVEIVVEQIGVSVERHHRGGVPEHPLYGMCKREFVGVTSHARTLHAQVVDLDIDEEHLHRNSAG
jgi:hypothetical protein